MGKSIQGVVVERDAGGNIVQLSGGATPVSGVPFTSGQQLTGAQIREMLAGGVNPTALTPVTLPRTSLVTQRLEPQKGTTLTPAQQAEAARKQAEINAAIAASVEQQRADIAQANVEREAAGREQIPDPGPFTPPPKGVMPDKRIHGIPLRAEPRPPTTQLPTENVVSETSQPSPPAPKSQTVLSGGDPVPGFPWTVGSPASQPGAPALPWRQQQGLLPAHEAPPIRGSVEFENKSQALGPDPFVPGFPETTEQITQKEAQQFLNPVVAPRDPQLEVQDPNVEPPISQEVAPNQPQVRPEQRIIIASGGGHPVPDFPWTVVKAKRGEGPAPNV